MTAKWHSTFLLGATVSRKNERFKERMRSVRVRQARAERLYRLGMVSVMLGIGLACLGVIKL
jgi:hypothetical protein